jgi:hypothetical protein
MSSDEEVDNFAAPPELPHCIEELFHEAVYSGKTAEVCVVVMECLVGCTRDTNGRDLAFAEEGKKQNELYLLFLVYDPFLMVRVFLHAFSV